MSESKQIEPTDAMVDEAASALSIDANGTSLHRRSDVVKHVYLKIARIALRAALRHPDAPGLFADEDAIRAAREQGWDEAVGWIEYDQGILSERTTNARLANPYRSAQELPTKDGAQIIPAHGAIEAVRNGVTYTTDRATYDGLEGVWVGVWRGENGHSTYEMPAENITPNTWQEAKK